LIHAQAIAILLRSGDHARRQGDHRRRLEGNCDFDSRALRDEGVLPRSRAENGPTRRFKEYDNDEDVLVCKEIAISIPGRSVVKVFC
jgi:hypothetical protein